MKDVYPVFYRIDQPIFILSFITDGVTENASQFIIPQKLISIKTFVLGREFLNSARGAAEQYKIFVSTFYTSSVYLFECYPL